MFKRILVVLAIFILFFDDKHIFRHFRRQDQSAVYKIK